MIAYLKVDTFKFCAMQITIKRIAYTIIRYLNVLIGIIMYYDQTWITKQNQYSIELTTLDLYNNDIHSKVYTKSTQRIQVIMVYFIWIIIMCHA